MAFKFYDAEGNRVTVRYYCEAGHRVKRIRRRWRYLLRLRQEMRIGRTQKGRPASGSHIFRRCWCGRIAASMMTPESRTKYKYLWMDPNKLEGHKLEETNDGSRIPSKAYPVREQM